MKNNQVNSLRAIIDAVKKVRNRHVVCIGDVMLDQYCYGTAERLSPEGPIPVLSIQKNVSMLGGAGNVIRNLSSMETATTLISVIGEDEPANEIARLFSELAQVETRFLKDRQRPTSLKNRYVCGNQQLLRVDRESTETITEDLELRLFKHFDDAVKNASAVVLSDYGKGVLTKGVIRHVIDQSRRLNVPIIVDPKGRDYSRYEGATIITPNRRELGEATNASLETLEDVAAAGKDIANSYGIDYIVATLGAQGMMVIGTSIEGVHIPTYAKSVFDVSGAGDTVVASFAIGLSSLLPLLDCAEFANRAAGVVVGKAGTATTSFAELIHEAMSHEQTPHEEQAFDLQNIIEQARVWRRMGLSVGFTNGCFDLLHVGHVKLLKTSKNACDRLIVGINSDSSVKRLKGNSRPILAEEHRATILASLSAVDAVTIFETDTPLELIHRLRPDVLVKGADYSESQVVGAEFVKSYGGRIVLVPLHQSQSTTSIAKKISDAQSL